MVEIDRIDIQPAQAGLAFGDHAFSLVATDVAGNETVQPLNVQILSNEQLIVRLETTDLSNSFISEIDAGEQFKVRAFVRVEGQRALLAQLVRHRGDLDAYPAIAQIETVFAHHVLVAKIADAGAQEIGEPTVAYAGDVRSVFGVKPMELKGLADDVISNSGNFPTPPSAARVLGGMGTDRRVEAKKAEEMITG